MVGNLNYFRIFPEHIAFDSEQPYVLVADRNMRLAGRIDTAVPEEAAAKALAFARSLPAEPPRNVVLPAPVLLSPNVFDLDFCRELIGVHKKGPVFESPTVSLGGDGQTRTLLNPERKIRQDFLIEPGHHLYDTVSDILARRVYPEIRRAFQFTITRNDIFLIARYPGGGGHFRRHRDDRPKAVAFRRFALSINLTPDGDDAYEGGFLRLPEFSQNHYRCPTGAAIIFSVALLHEITPVIRGDRYVLVTHLFDDQGEIERRAAQGERAQAVTC